MNHVSFGSLLREARIQKGYEINTVSRRLRIRPDIIKAIEDSDFERMPARGYARNMVNAYAKLVGLNPNTITRMYLDEIYAHQIGQANNEADISRSMQRVSASQVRRGSSQRRTVDTYDDGYPRTPRNGRTTNRAMYTDDRRAGTSLYTQDQFHPSRRPVISEGNYLNAVAGGTGRGGRFNPRTIAIIVAAVVVLLLLIFGISRCVGGNQEETQNIPVTGVESQQNGENGENGESTEAAPVVTETAPTSFTLAYNLADGNSTYIEVYVDGSTQEAHDVSGPAKKEYTSSDNIKFVCTDTTGLTVTVDGEEQTLEPNSNGVCTIDIKFQDILDQWNADHPAATSSSSSSSSSSSNSSSDSSSSTSSGTSGSSTSSTSSNSTQSSGGNSSSSNSGSSNSGNSGNSNSNSNN